MTLKHLSMMPMHRVACDLGLGLCDVWRCHLYMIHSTLAVAKDG